MTTRYITLASRIKREIEELKKLVKRAIKAWNNALLTKDDLYIDSVTLNIHGFYSALEKIFEMIAREIDSGIPSGDSWHTELLKQMSIPIDGIRPAVISSKLFSILDEFRGFRHIERNAYTYNISLKKLTPLIESLENTSKMFENELMDFLAFIKDRQDNG
jgi:hypothetical protein